MLNSFRTHTTMPVLDLGRAKKFYVDTLGFKFESENPAATILSAAEGSRVVLFTTPNPSRGGHTQLGVAVDDVNKVVAELKKRGVAFEEYDFPGLKTENSVATTGGGRAAWFKDSEGNMIGLIQFA